MQPPGEVASLRYHTPAMMTHLSSFLVAPYCTQLRPTKGSPTRKKLDEKGIFPIDERRRRRMISNRESARRSRMRKQKHLEELWSQVVYLTAEKQRLIQDLRRVVGDGDRVLRENSHLRLEASGLREALRELQGKIASGGEVQTRSHA